MEGDGASDAPWEQALEHKCEVCLYREGERRAFWVWMHPFTFSAHASAVMYVDKRRDTAGCVLWLLWGAHNIFFRFTFPWNDPQRTRKGRANIPKLQSSQQRVIKETEDITQILIITTSSHLPTAGCVTQKNSKNRLEQMSASPCRKCLQYPRDTSKTALSPATLHRFQITEFKQEGGREKKKKNSKAKGCLTLQS